MNKQLVRFLLIAAASLVFATPAQPQSPATGATVQLDRFQSEIAAFTDRDAVRMPPRCATLFVGSSSIRLWGDLDRRFAFRIVQRGVGGSTIREINRYFGTIVAPYRPARIVFYAGENDINDGRDPQLVADDFRQFLALKRAALGATPVYFIAAKPSPSRVADLDRQRFLNRAIRSMALRSRDLAFIDVATPMAPDGHAIERLFGPDRLHMNASGYDIWQAAITSALRRPAKGRSPFCPKGAQ